jgi:hypothetical protein
LLSILICTDKNQEKSEKFSKVENLNQFGKENSLLPTHSPVMATFWTKLSQSFFSFILRLFLPVPEQMQIFPVCRFSAGNVLNVVLILKKNMSYGPLVASF